VYVTGQTWNAQDLPEYATIAYDASSGKQLWASLHAGHAASGGPAAADSRAIVVSPDGKVVYVTGHSGHAGAGGRINRGVYDYVTIAYDAVTGKALWTTRYDNGANDQGRAIAIGPSGHVVYVTGRSFAKNTGYDDATIAYNAATGRKLWVARYNGKASKDEFANAITVAPDGKSVYITGGSYGMTSRIDFATVRYGTATGKQLWVGRYNGPGNLNDSGVALAVSPDNTTVVVTGGERGKGRHVRHRVGHHRFQRQDRSGALDQAVRRHRRGRYGRERSRGRCNKPTRRHRVHHWCRRALQGRGLLRDGGLLAQHRRPEVGEKL
jgi:hypothetical protein